MKKSLLFILGLILITITSCEYNTFEPVVVELPDEPISFATDVEPIFSVSEANCTQCHGNSGGLTLETGNAFQSIMDNGLVDTANPEESKIYEYPSLTGGHSYKRYSPTQAAYVLQWIKEGAEDN